MNGAASTSLPLRVGITRRAGWEGGRNLSGWARTRGFPSSDDDDDDFLHDEDENAQRPITSRADVELA